MALKPICIQGVQSKLMQCKCGVFNPQQASMTLLSVPLQEGCRNVCVS